ncbi:MULTISPECIES: hypothetical protein [Candidatus Nitrosocaldus]|jgi:hypothetical protein|uniref:Uncharacterized protein n=1 Tax=Candidatus Nitrosocaldus cavascurensis TaxID=2058097 RepID=A0A2K5AQ67_9ARCH|nr:MULTISPECIES: hypothetical protein [Candidatus Nitrosocaldus]SPC33764.1 conserved protein of unknown function [Candidatus Nitrosocaldus cavascurensis]
MVNNSSIDPILLGDNPLMGVDHLSQERARQRGIASASNIISLLEFAYSMNVRGFVASTHPQLKGVIEYMLEHSDLATKINFYPIIPYAYGYVRQMTEKGIVATITDALAPASMHEKMRIVFSGGLSMLRKDINGLLKTFIDVELLQFNNVNVRCIFLHDVLVDLALALRLRNIFELFIEHVEDKHNAKAGFVTKNFSRLVRQLNEWAIDEKVIMAPFNKVGFQMNPSREECEEALRECKHDVIAMSTLAAGYLKPAEAYEYLFRLPNIRSVVVGVSSKKHAEETFRLLNDRMMVRSSK